MRQEVYSGTLKLYGEENRSTMLEADNYAGILVKLNRFEEARSLLRKSIPVARRVLGESDRLTLEMRWCYATALYQDEGASLDDRREAVATLESVAHSWKRIFGPAHPETPEVQEALKEAREALARRTAASSSGAK